MNKIDITKTYIYRNGQPARILCVDANSPRWPTVSLDKHGGVHWHTECGYFWLNEDEHEFDLIEVKQKKSQTVWLNIYPAGVNEEMFDCEEAANQAAGKGRLGCQMITIEWEGP